MSALGGGAGNGVAPNPRDPPEGRLPVDLAGFASSLVGVGVGGMASRWPKPCTQDPHPVQAMPGLSPARLLFDPLHRVFGARSFSATSLGEVGWLRPAAKACFFFEKAEPQVGLPSSIWDRIQASKPDRPGVKAG